MHGSALRLALLFCIALSVVGCSDRDLRGHSTPSPDGKTYLVLEDDNGGKCGQLRLDGVDWTAGLNTPVEITPGSHSMSCGDPATHGFEVREGQTFHFDYWGP